MALRDVDSPPNTAEQHALGIVTPADLPSALSSSKTTLGTAATFRIAFGAGASAILTLTVCLFFTRPEDIRSAPVSTRPS